ncbi:MAG: 50S ribosomal protein L33 [Christensenellaceae bacterium]|jgi:large subunit ribosomal protein L33|nr:50S ribosomal protein L33 [Christensenellaceae bacterium]
MAKKAKGNRIKITLVCEACGQRNYDTQKNKKNDNERITLEKYCRFCKKATAHKESK